MQWRRNLQSAFASFRSPLALHRVDDVLIGLMEKHDTEGGGVDGKLKMEVLMVCSSTFGVVGDWLEHRALYRCDELDEPEARML